MEGICSVATQETVAGEGDRGLNLESDSKAKDASQRRKHHLEEL
jgi:hypothetical protein